MQAKREIEHESKILTTFRGWRLDGAIWRRSRLDEVVGGVTSLTMVLVAPGKARMGWAEIEVTADPVQDFKILRPAIHWLPSAREPGV